MGRYANASYCRARYAQAQEDNVCGRCFKAPRTRGVLCHECWRLNTERNRAQPRKTARRWGSRAIRVENTTTPGGADGNEES